MNKSLEMSSLRNIKFTDATRYRTAVKPFGTGSVSESGSPYLTYKLPRSDVLDGAHARHYFTAEVDGDAAADDAFHSNIRSIWRSIRVQVGSEDVQNVLQAGHLAVILDNLYLKADERATRCVVAQGLPALSSSGVGVKYGHDLSLPGGFLENLIPLYKIPQVEIIFELNQSLAEHTNATTAVTELDVTSSQLILPMIRSKELVGKLNAGDYQITFTDYDLFEDTSLLSGASSHTVVVPASHKSVTGLILTMRNQADVSDPNYGTGKYETAYLTNALTKCYFVIDGQQIPRQAIDCTNQVEMFDYMAEFAGGLDKLGNHWNGTYDTATDGRFVMFFPLNGQPFDSNVVSGTNLNDKTGQIQIELSQMTASANTQIRGWVRYNRIVSFGQSGSVVVSK